MTTSDPNQKIKAEQKHDYKNNAVKLVAFKNIAKYIKLFLFLECLTNQNSQQVPPGTTV